jgi:hypothetical protein
VHRPSLGNGAWWLEMRGIAFKPSLSHVSHVVWKERDNGEKETLRATAYSLRNTIIMI